MRRIRFSLRALLKVATALILFLGYSQWRRNWIHEECQALMTLGVDIVLPNELRDNFWQDRQEQI
jgi:hypothetical protein